MESPAPSHRSYRASPLIGILGVIMGAGIVTLAGRMLTLGLGDLKGSLGIGFDSGAWIGSSFNMALMFIGPFTVYLGGLIGARRILLTCAAAFTMIYMLLPFVHSYSLLITGLVLAGLTSGTFYPLTLTFALRNIPLRFLPFTLALYATFVDVSVNAAPSLYGWCRNDLSWRWMFWLVALITPFMMACIYFGIPKTPAVKRPGPAPSFAGFLYGSAGLAMLFGAIDQGQRLGLVAFRALHRPVPRRDAAFHMRTRAPPLPAKSIGRSAVSGQAEHLARGPAASCSSAFVCWPRSF